MSDIKEKDSTTEKIEATKPAKRTYTRRKTTTQETKAIKASTTKKRENVKMSQKDIEKNVRWHDALNRSPSNENTLSVLNSVYTNVTMAYDAINAIIPYSKNDKFTDILRSQGEKYNEFLNRAKDLAEEMGCEIEGGAKFGNTMAKASMKMKLAFNSTTTKIAEMMIQGTTMGIIDMGKLLRHTPDVMPKTLDLAREVMEFEEDKVEILKHHL